MLQVARLAPTQLGESRDLVAAFLRSLVTPDGRFQDRAGAGDLYYTVFGLDGLIALQEEAPSGTRAYLEQFDAVEGLDFVHAACLARGWAGLHHRPDPSRADALLRLVESCRSDDGGYATSSGATHGSAYAAFLALGVYQDLGLSIPSPVDLLTSLRALKAHDGSYANQPGAQTGLTTTTAAAVMVQRHLDAAPDRDAGVWLLDRCHESGGFYAARSAPMPDLLSTATALHALSSLHVPTGALREPCLDFVDTLWTNRGGFFGSWGDDIVDCEYTYYALLALGHLSLEPS